MANLPISARRVDRFTPPGYDDADPKPVFLLKVLTQADRVDFQAACLELGLYFPSDAEMMREVRAMLGQVDPESAAPHLQTVEALEAAAAARADAEKRGEEPEPMDPDLVVQGEQLARLAMKHWQPYRELQAQRHRWMQHSGLVLLRLFCLGIENCPGVTYRREFGRMAEEVLEQIKPADAEAVQLRLWSLFTPSKERDVPNSERPSQSLSDRSTSMARNSRKTAVPAGRSPAASSSATPPIN